MRVGRRRTDGKPRTGLLLITLITAYLLSALSSGRFVQAVQVALFVTVTLLTLAGSALPPRVKKLARWGAVGGSVVAIFLATLGGAPGRGVADIWTGLLLLLTVTIILDLVLRLDTVTVQSIYAALSAYLLIGLMFASFFGAIDNLTHTDFFANGQPADIQTYQYFSFTTLTTLGYGDFTAAENFGRAVAVIEALTGQIFLATLVARLVSAYRGPRQGEPPSGENGDPGTPAG
jgi:hypothetical protein